MQLQEGDLPGKQPRAKLGLGSVTASIEATDLSVSLEKLRGAFAVPSQSVCQTVIVSLLLALSSLRQGLSDFSSLFWDCSVRR